MLRIAREILNTVDMAPFCRASPALIHDNVLSGHGQQRVGLPVVGALQAARPGMGTEQADNAPATTGLQREDLDLPVALENTKDDDFARGAPPAFAFSTAPKGGFVAFDHPLEGRPQVLGVGAAGPRQAVEPLCRVGAGQGAKPLLQDRQPQDKPFQKLMSGALRQKARPPSTPDDVAGPTPLALVAVIRELPAPCVVEFRTSFHLQTSLQLLRFG